MPLTRVVADALGVVTISLVSLLAILGLICILYSFYFQYRIQSRGFLQLGYFNRPWIIRIALILFSIWWGIGEVVRLSFLRQEERIFHSLSLKWQENVCKLYVISNLGFAEPCLFLTIVFLLRASLQQRSLGTSNQYWNLKTAGYIILNCIPMLTIQIIFVLAAPKFNRKEDHAWRMPHYFINAASFSKTDDSNVIALCTYPLLGTILLGLFATLLTSYLLWLGRKMVSSVINKGLRRRVYFLIFSVSSFFPSRVLLLGLSVLSRPEHFLFEALVFLAFFAMLLCAGFGICMLVYFPVADSLALRSLRDLETGRPADDHNDAASLLASQSLVEVNSNTSLGRNSDASTKRGSISFRTMLKDETPPEAFEELNLFSPGMHRFGSPPGSPPLPGYPMLPL
ncbi:hypothetical protein Syun_014514 [Stephania yunnanensis]|uniref:Uncharacterized protein n=1 Tax=Stephania yunnanensis TaxID=152371 RepID=A0AAP0JJX0_9MAGN